MTALGLLLALLASASALPLSSNAVEKNEFVLGGTKATVGLIPMQAVIEWRMKPDGRGPFICGGTLISPNHVLTAAHCTTRMKTAKIMVGGVEYYQNTTSTQWRHVTKIHSHPQYNKSDLSGVYFNNDIGIVEFSPAVTLGRNVKLATLIKNDNSYLREKKIVVSGYGVKGYGGKYGNESIGSSDLLYTGVQIYNFSYCNEARANLGARLSYNQFCAGGPGKGMGLGDSGGPIQVVLPGQLIQIGIASYASVSPKYATKLPVVFTRVSPFCDYISSITNGAAKCK